VLSCRGNNNKRRHCKSITSTASNKQDIASLLGLKGANLLGTMRGGCQRQWNFCVVGVALSLCAQQRRLTEKGVSSQLDAKICLMRSMELRDFSARVIVVLSLYQSPQTCQARQRRQKTQTTGQAEEWGPLCQVLCAEPGIHCDKVESP
jgi:hypothetical protein